MNTIRSYRRSDWFFEAKDDVKDAKKIDDSKKDDKESLKSKLGKMIADAFNNYAADKAGDLIDELMLGNFKDALIDVFKEEAKATMDDKKIQEVAEELKNNAQYKKAADYAALDSRKDDNTKTDVDKDSIRKFIMWYSKDKEANLGATINEVVTSF